MTICIAGMHRSGTSMVARLLQQSGLYLGDESSFLPPKPDNPEGFFEHADFVALNDDVLRALGGAWDTPPRATWAVAPELPALRARAAALVDELAAHAPWGWKDPRNSLTLPFWQSVVPDLRVVVCLRNPIAVARSLAHRAGVTEAFGLRLWQAYHERILAAVPADELVVTHYHAYFTDAPAELRRVCRLLGLEPTDEVIAAATATIRDQLLHHRPTTGQVVATVAHHEVVETYLRLCSLAGPVCVAALAAEPFGAPPATAARAWMDEVLRARVQKVETEIAARADALEAEQIQRDARHAAALAERDAHHAAALAERDARITTLEALAAEQAHALNAARAEQGRLQAEVNALRTQVTELGRRASELAEAHAATSAQLTAITWERDHIVQSRAWAVMRLIWRVRRAVAAPGNRRARLPRATGS
jgi:hypothetical protein